jgi:hypothetical protein
MHKGTPLRRLAVTTLLALTAQALSADEPISAVTARFEDPQRLLVSARVSFPLTEAIERAVHHGVPLVLLTEIELQQERPWIWDDEMARVERRSELRYHALSGRYLLQVDGLERIENFRTLEEALRHHGRLAGVPLQLAEPWHGASRALRVAIRSRIEAQELPLLVRLLPVGAAAWRQDTGWRYFAAGPAP